MTPPPRPHLVVTEPWFNIFPVFAALTCAALAVGLLRKASTLGGLVWDWVVAFALASCAFVGALAASLVSWNLAGETVVAAGGASVAVAFIGAFSGVVHRHSGGRIGTATFRWVTFAAALGLATFGWGARAGGAAVPGDSVADPWATVPIAAGLALLVPVAYLAARRSLKHGKQSDTIQFFSGALLIGAGFFGLALGDMLVGSGLGVMGAAFMYSGASAVVGLAPAGAERKVAARIDRPPRFKPEAGRKVRVPKGKAMEVSAFRDDGLPPNQHE
jgi:hypothetical protein